MPSNNIVGINRNELEHDFYYSLVVDFSLTTLSDSGLEYLSNLALNPRCEVIAVVDTVDAQFEKWGITSLVAQGSLAERYDQASKIATGKILLFANGVDAFDYELLDKLDEIFEDPYVTALRIPVIRESGTSAMAVAVNDAVSELFLKRLNLKSVGGDELNPLCYLQHMLLGVRRADFIKVGGFRVLPNGFGASGRLALKLTEISGSRQLDLLDLRLPRPSFSNSRELINSIRSVSRESGYLNRRMPEVAGTFGTLRRFFVIGAVIVALIFAFVTGGSAVASGVFFAALLFMLVGIVRELLSSSRIRESESGSVKKLVAASQLLIARGFVAAFALPEYLKSYLRAHVDKGAPKATNEKQLRVLVLNWRDRTHPRSGGAENYVYHLAQHWIENGIEIGWLTQRPRGGKSHEFIKGIEYFRIGGPISQYILVPFKYLTSLRGRYDVILDCENGIPFFSPLFSRLPKVLLVHHVHQEIFRRELPTPLRQLAMALEGKLMPIVYQRCEVVAVANQVKEDLVGIGFDAEAITVVKNGVHLPRKFSTSLRSESPSLLCLGRLVPQKSVDVLIRAVARLAAERADITVNIVGQGPERERLERLAISLGIASKVHFHGHASNEELDRLFDESWISVCPSAYEGWGMVCMEASAKGLPVVASNVPGLRDSVRDGETGVLFEYGDHNALAAVVTELLADESRRAELGLAGRNWAAMHSWRASAELFEDLLYGVSGLQQAAEKVADNRVVIDFRTHSVDLRLGKYFEESNDLGTESAPIDPSEKTREIR